MKPLKKSDDVGACLALLLLILGLGLMDSFIPEYSPPPLPCSKPRFVEAAGDVPYPGVYGFCGTPATASTPAVRSAGKDHRSILKVLEKSGLHSGAKVVFIDRPGEEKDCRIEGMSAFYLLTLGMSVPINRCSLVELTALPGIGPGLARAIVEYRERADGFERVEDLLRVRGIGPRTLKRLKPHITVQRTAGFTGPS